MKYLILYAHPNPKSFCHAIKDEIEAQLKAQGHTFITRDLYQMNFNAILGAPDFIGFAQKKIPADIKAEQDLVIENDRILCIYPVWWFNLPAILKGYIDRVFSRGFAYDQKGHVVIGLLKNKEVMLFNTTGGPRFAYHLLGYRLAMYISITLGIFRFCGLRVIRHQYFYAVPAISHAARTKMLADLKNIRF